jgi:hypothetical protein
VSKEAIPLGKLVTEKPVDFVGFDNVAASYFALYPPVRLKEVLSGKSVNHEWEIGKPHRVSAMISHCKPKVARFF